MALHPQGCLSRFFSTSVHHLATIALAIVACVTFASPAFAQTIAAGGAVDLAAASGLVLADTDRDGVLDVAELSSSQPAPHPDADGDGVPNSLGGSR